MPNPEKVSLVVLVCTNCGNTRALSTKSPRLNPDKMCKDCLLGVMKVVTFNDSTKSFEMEP